MAINLSAHQLRQPDLARRILSTLERHGLDPSLLVCELTERYGWGGRVAVGHVSKLASMPQPDMDKVARRMADAGVALTVLTATDLYLGGRHTDHNVPRNVLDLNFLTERGVTCSVASNTILNPFTPFGDGQLLRQVSCAVPEQTPTPIADLGFRGLR